MVSNIIGFFGQAAISFLLLLGLVAFLGMRRPISVRASTFIRKPAEAVFGIIDFAPGEQFWHRGRAVVRSLDEEQRLYRVTYTTRSPGAADHVIEADFKVATHDPPFRLIAERHGLGRRTTNQLVKLDAAIGAEGEGCRLTLQYDWGPRTLLAHVLAPMDLRGSLGRIKSLAETGKVDDRHEGRLSVLVAAATGALTLAGFGWWLGWASAALLVVVLVVHELGHLIAFRLIGQPWGRILFIPFLGALAVPRLPLRTERECAFAALMGPGFSLTLLLAALILAGSGAPHAGQLVFITALINGLNLLPVMPLDGGHVARAVLQSLAPRHIRTGMSILAIAIAAAGLLWRRPILLAVALVAVFGASQGERRLGYFRQPMSLIECGLTAAALILLAVLFGGVLAWGMAFKAA